MSKRHKVEWDAQVPGRVKCSCSWGHQSSSREIAEEALRRHLTGEDMVRIPAPHIKRHGTRSCYVGGCRCEHCTKANAEYQKMRLRRQTHPDIWGEVTDLVDATEAREMLVELVACGVGLRRMEEVSGLPRSSLKRILDGTTRRVRRSTVEALGHLTPSHRAAGAVVDARATWDLIDLLLSAGYTRTKIARLIGNDRALQLGRVTVRRSTEMKVRKVFDELLGKDARLRIALESRSHSRT